MKTYIKGCVCVLAAFLSTQYYAQTNPTPFNLNASGNFAFSAWASSSSTGTYPANMIFHLLNSTNPPVTAVAQSDLLTGYNYSHTSGTRVQGLGSAGVQFQNATTPANTGYTANKLGETVLGLVTTARTQVQLSWKAQTKTTAGNVMAIRCQYRIGSTGLYSDLTPISEYMSSATLNDSASFSVTLPASLDNQPLVQVRWIYYKVSGSSSSSRTIRLDDISVTSIPIVTLSQMPDVCINAAAFAITDGSPMGGTYSGTGVVNGSTFDPSVSGAGTFAITYTYTDANSISNSASTNIVVSSNACVLPVGLAFNSCGATGLMKNSYIYTESAPGAQDYEYEFSGGDLSSVITRRRTNWYTDFNLSWIPQLNYGQSYNVRVRTKVANTWGTFANSCSVTLAASAPFPQLTNASCGATGLALNSYIYTTTITSAQDYEYKFVNASLNYTGTRMRGNGFTDLNLNWVSGLRYGNTYDVSVRVKVNGVWSAFGSTCQITLQPFPVTTLTAASCGATNLTQADKIYVNPVPGATNYQYRFTPVAGGNPIIRARNAALSDFTLSYAAGLMASTTYNVEVRAMAGGVWGTFGASCQVSTSGSYSTVMPITENFSYRLIDEEQQTPVLGATMYPNPAMNRDVLKINLQGYGDNNIALVQIYDLSGKLAATQQVTLSPESTLVELNLENFERGLYFVTITAGEQKITQQLVVGE